MNNQIVVVFLLVHKTQVDLSNICASAHSISPKQPTGSSPASVHSTFQPFSRHFIFHVILQHAVCVQVTEKPPPVPSTPPATSLAGSPLFKATCLILVSPPFFLHVSQRRRRRQSAGIHCGEGKRQCSEALLWKEIMLERERERKKNSAQA